MPCGKARPAICGISEGGCHSRRPGGGSRGFQLKVRHAFFGFCTRLGKSIAASVPVLAVSAVLCEIATLPVFSAVPAPNAAGLAIAAVADKRGGGRCDCDGNCGARR